MRILVVCGAGASSTFVAQRINKAARARSLDYSATASDEASLTAALESSDLVLLGPHVAARLDRVKELAAPRGIEVVVLDAQVFSDLDGTKTLAQIEAVVSEEAADHPTDRQP